MEDYVKQIGDRFVLVCALTPANTEVILNLGGAADGRSHDLWQIGYDTEDQLAKVLQTLRDANLAFAGGSSGWPPAAVAEILRDKGKLHGVIREVTWSAPNQQILQDR